MAREIAWQLEIDWTLDGTWVDESGRLLSASGSVRLADPESSISSPRGTTSSCELVLNNFDGRYSARNSAGPLFAALGNGNAYHAPMRLAVSIDGGDNFYRVFSGVLKIPRERPATAREASTVSIDCRSRDEPLLNRTMSTLHSTFVALHAAQATEAEVIAQVLQDAGVSESDTALDPGLFVVPWVWLDDESPLEDIWQLAAACGGRFYCDQAGIYRYENMLHWLQAPHTTSQASYSEDNYSVLDSPIYDDRELYSAVHVVATPRELLATSVLWAAEGILTVPANSTKRVIAKFRQPAYTIDSPTFDAVTDGSFNIDEDISIAVTKYAQRAELEITNSSMTDAANLIDLTITGIPISGSPSIEVQQESTESFWVDHADVRPGRTRRIAANPYVQSEPQATVLAKFLRDRYQLPRATGRIRNTPGDARRSLGDRITVSHAGSFTSPHDGMITEISFRLGNFGFVQDITYLDATGLYPFGPGAEFGYFVVGTNTLGDGSLDDNAVLFY